MKSKSQELLDKSVGAMVSAIEIYNKPDFLYRGETFAILAINSWELLLKAKYLRTNHNKMRSLYVFESKENKDGSKSRKKSIKLTRSGNPFTHSLDFIAKKLIISGDMRETAYNNIEALIELRDSAVHFYNYSMKFNIRIQEIGTATLKNYVTLFNKWFGKDLSKFNFYLMPLSFVAQGKQNDVLLLNNEEKNFFKYVNQLEELRSNEDLDYSIALNVNVNFSRSTLKDEIKMAYSNDETAIKVFLTEQQIQEKYPFDYGTLTDKCKNRYTDFCLNGEYHNCRRKYESDCKCAYIRYLDPQNKKGSKKIFYSETMLSKLDKHYVRK